VSQLDKRAEKKRDNCAAVNYLIDLLVAARPKKALHLAVVAAAVPASSTVNAHAAALPPLTPCITPLFLALSSQK
jgi:hypothetical protein